MKSLLIVSVFCTALAGAYYVGTLSSSGTKEPKSSEPQNLEEIAKLESDFNQQQINLTNRLTDVKNKIETVKLNLDFDESDTNLKSKEIQGKLAMLEEEGLSSSDVLIKSSVPIPKDSPDGILLDKPRSSSGVSLEVLNSYQQETGVSPEEIEELMRRTK